MKYKVTSDEANFSKNFVTAKLLRNIGNELAEMNRLKTIELKLLSKSHINMETINKEIDEGRLN